ncbi:MAG: hypothetical protein A2X67_04930 [Ignavibacteria bacterium GWA2_55_11]|nr:MAG: hypothetical protein A2X67_04930 [Ignavibacteria bacterium GWA2_55_11]OGU45914.1 MAG: hypothetical protein A2X68_00465 [Ignavibacteria bacterium GWC2_56_12]OGU66173.1 MAG: hypothetical protein A3C56_03470 [Ignavibacteria bacterium RIFCSPHIGHO2_02_FULL_56_12]OGU69562.1 MAG: hypothetical protein A3H45_07900 [Ignavibacteria bacterium RIFCSPLOWO2_02_FULL_55_14]OGU71796.1 MAG: hypothetical protein A3G43_07430 [Ignavibacteria bacterium RIFCSPLOWO2_12_FULL_56_21]HAV22762.1 hypothetical protei
MNSAAPDLKLFTNDNLRAQLETAAFRNGYYVLEFYADERGKPSSKPTGRVAVFYLYPSGGTLRDKDFNLLWYDSQYDTYRGFRPPHMRTQ